MCAILKPKWLRRFATKWVKNSNRMASSSNKLTSCMCCYQRTSEMCWCILHKTMFTCRDKSSSNRIPCSKFAMLRIRKCSIFREIISRFCPSWRTRRRFAIFSSRPALSKRRLPKNWRKWLPLRKNLSRLYKQIVSRLGQRFRHRGSPRRRWRALVHMNKRRRWLQTWLSRQSSRTPRHAWPAPVTRRSLTQRNARRSWSFLPTCSHLESTIRKWACLNHCSGPQRMAGSSWTVKLAITFSASTTTPWVRLSTTDD